MFNLKLERFDPEKPLTRGFIFPSGETLEVTPERGHIVTADRWLKQNGEKNYVISPEDYLMEKHKCAIVGAWRGKRVLYLSRGHNDFMTRVKHTYRENGYKIIYLGKSNITYYSLESLQPPCYSNTVVEFQDSNGDTFYMYNPWKIGD